MMSSKAVSLFWFRNDLRTVDNPGLVAAVEEGSTLPIYIVDDTTPKAFQQGEASRWWCAKSLAALNKLLKGSLNVYRGDPTCILKDLTARFEITHVYWNRCYEPWQIARDKALEEALGKQSITVHSFNASLLFEPWQVDVLKSDLTPYKVFTPFYKKGYLSPDSKPRKPLPVPSNPRWISDPQALGLDKLGLSPTKKWIQKLENTWQVGESAALKRFDQFIKKGLGDYKVGRDFPSQENVSRLSPYLHFGEISPNQVYHKVKSLGSAVVPPKDVAHFLSELGWREFSYYLLYHFPDLPEKNFQSNFDRFPWRYNESHLKAWQKGMTGIPFVDAGMRQLWQEGYMHNRVRMLVASVLVKNMLIHWHHGRDWFWDCLVDADLASNSASWQWVAGSGADAAPYFRIFNPIRQSERFDPKGKYIKKWIPQLRNLNPPHLFAPWEAPTNVLKAAGITLGEDYPFPIVDLKASRDEALAAYRTMRR